MPCRNFFVNLSFQGLRSYKHTGKYRNHLPHDEKQPNVLDRKGNKKGIRERVRGGGGPSWPSSIPGFIVGLLLSVGKYSGDDLDAAVIGSLESGSYRRASVKYLIVSGCSITLVIFPCSTSGQAAERGVPQVKLLPTASGVSGFACWGRRVPGRPSDACSVLAGSLEDALTSTVTQAGQFLAEGRRSFCISRWPALSRQGT